MFRFVFAKSCGLESQENVGVDFDKRVVVRVVRFGLSNVFGNFLLVSSCLNYV